MNVEQILTKIRESFEMSGERINRGRCEEFANKARNILGGQICWYKGHCFLELNDKYYDAEDINGVKNPSDFVAVKRDLAEWAIWMKRTQIIGSLRKQ